MEEVLLLRAALQARLDAISAIVQEHHQVARRGGDLAHVDTEPRDVPEERRDAAIVF